MGSPSLAEISATKLSTNQFSQLTGLDRRTIDKYFEAEGVKSTGTGKANAFNLREGIKALIFCSKGQSSADRRNEAQARKAEVETEILQQKWIKIEEIEEPIRLAFSNMNSVIQASKLDEEEKERIVSRLRESVEDWVKLPEIG